MANVRTTQSAAARRPTGTSDDSPPAGLIATGDRRRRRLMLMLAVVSLLVVGFGARTWYLGRTRIHSDNAQVEGHITPVLSRVGAYIAEVWVTDNQRVQAGDTLVVLDDRELLVRLAQAEAELSAALAMVGDDGDGGQANARVRAAQAAAAAAEAAVRQMEATASRARADLARLEPLAERNIVSQQQLDAARAAATAAEAQLLAARQNAIAARNQITSESAGVTSANARVEAARAARDQVLLELSYTRVIAPRSGIVSRLNLEPGQLVSPGQPLMSLVPLDDVWVVANLKETEIADVKPGDPVEFTVDAYGSHVFHGTVESLSPATGAKFSLLPPDNATGNFTRVVQRIPVRVRVDDGADEAHPLRPGMSAKVVISTRSS